MATNLVTGMSYIGATTRSLKQRRGRHEWDASRGTPFPFHLALCEYGFDSFVWRILKDGITTKEELDREEEKFIAIFETFTDGYNSDPTGRTRGRCSEETKKKMSESGKRNHSEHPRKFSLESRKKMSASQKRRQLIGPIQQPIKIKKEKVPTIKTPVSEETKKKMSEAGIRRHRELREARRRPADEVKEI